MSAPSKQAIADLQKDHAPLTEAEARWVLRHEERGEGSVDELVVQVKAMRVGPSADFESLAVTAEPDAEALDEIREDDPDDARWSLEEIGAANASDLVEYVKAFPDDAERVAQVEGSRDGGARKTVLDAVSGALDEPEEES